jgi:hypothetical protein
MAKHEGHRKIGTQHAGPWVSSNVQDKKTARSKTKGATRQKRNSKMSARHALKELIAASKKK